MKIHKKIILICLVIITILGFSLLVPIIPYKATSPKSDCMVMIGYPKGGAPICEPGNATIIQYILNPDLRGGNK